MSDLVVGHVHRARQEIVHQRGRADPAVGVVDELLHERFADALGHTAHHLTVDDHRVDDSAAVVHDDVALDVDGPVCGIDSHLCDVGGVGHGDQWRVVEVGLLDAEALAFGQVAGVHRIRRLGDLLERERSARHARDVHPAVGYHDVFWRRLEHERGDPRQLQPGFLRRPYQRSAARDCAAAGEGVGAVGPSGSVALDDGHIFKSGPERVGDNLREGREVALP